MISLALCETVNIVKAPPDDRHLAPAFTPPPLSLPTPSQLHNCTSLVSVHKSTPSRLTATQLTSLALTTSIATPLILSLSLSSRWWHFFSLFSSSRPGTPPSATSSPISSSQAPLTRAVGTSRTRHHCRGSSWTALVAATPNVSDIFQEHLVAGNAGGGGLTVFCPDDKAVAAFEPTFRAIADSDQVNVLLHHGAAARYVRAQFAGFGLVAVPTLAAADAATSETQTVLVRDMGDTIRLWPTWPQDGVASVTKTVSSSETPLVLYVVDAVLLRQKLDGADEAAACGGQGGGYFSWLYCCIPVWAVLCWVLAAIVGFLSGWFGRSMAEKLRIKDAVMRIMH